MLRGTIRFSRLHGGCRRQHSPCGSLLKYNTKRRYHCEGSANDSRYGSYSSTTSTTFKASVSATTLILLGLISSSESTKASHNDIADTTTTTGVSTTIHEISGKKFASIVVGGGTGGCTAAFFLAKWMHDQNIPGDVLLLERGVDYWDPKRAGSPKIAQWYEQWGSYGSAHETKFADGDPDGDGHYPVMPTDHRGLGGCSTHDTRIQFQYRDRHKVRVAHEMNMTVPVFDTYFQAMLDVIPMSPAIPEGQQVKFYEDVIEKVDELSDIKRLPGNEHKTGVVWDSIAISTIAMYANKDHLRWTPAWLLHDSVRPPNLKILTDVTVDKIEFDEEMNATGVSLEKDGKLLKVCLEDENGEILLTSGAMGNPAVMQRSGLGPKAVLEKVGVKTLVDNPSIGHGCDHEEIAILYEWVGDKYNDENGEIPHITMGWPLILFGTFRPELKFLFDKGGSSKGSTAAEGFLAHFGAGYCDPYTDFPAIAVTPSCILPDMSEEGGFRVQITDKSPHKATMVVQGDHRRDIEAMAQGMYALTGVFEKLREKGIVGKQLFPPFPIIPQNRDRLCEWIKRNHWTVFHWACSTQAGRNGRVADENFRVLVDNQSRETLKNVRVGSASALPELPESNPSLSVCAFSLMLADRVVQSRAEKLGLTYNTPTELVKARQKLSFNNGVTKISRTGQETPSMKSIVEKHSNALDEVQAEQQ